MKQIKELALLWWSGAGGLHGITRYYHLFFLILVFIGTNVISFYAALKRYNNFEFGKFDLGNMSQMVWNTANGRPLMLTDQFGTDMSRLGMSHFDPIILLFVPIFAVFAHPMILVFLQHLSFVSSIFPIYFISNKKLNSKLASVIIALTFILYPAVGYTLVWTEFHGITFVSSLFLWLVYFLESKNYLKAFNKKDLLVYSLLILLLLSGKEEIGSMLAIYALLFFFKNKKLAIATFVFSTLWFVCVFFILIPTANKDRDISVNSFITFVGEKNTNNDEEVQGKNFFYKRYSYLGSTYSEMITNAVKKPNAIFENTPYENNQKTFLYLFGPLLFIPVLSLVWLVGLPDFAITLLSDEEIFKISNHRISFIIVAIFLSYILGMAFIKNRVSARFASKAVLILSVVILLVNLGTSIYLANPLVFNLLNRFGVYKFVTPVIAEAVKESKTDKLFATSKADLPANDLLCLTKARDYVLAKNPSIYSGPDYLGAKLALRQTNAIFPARIDVADIFIADFLEDKAFEPLDSADSWTLNKRVLRNNLANGKTKHVFSCGRINVFEKSDSSQIGESRIIDQVEKANYTFYQVSAKKFGINFALIKEPSKESSVVEYAIERQKSVDLNDKLLFWRFETASGKRVEMIDYAPFALPSNISKMGNEQALLIQLDLDFVSKALGDEPIHASYGISNQLDGQEIYLGEWDF